MIGRFTVTYETVTPESAEIGDAEDCGFLDSHGIAYSVRGIWGEAAGALKAENRMRLRDAAALADPQESEAGAFREVDGRVDYATGAEERRTIHAPTGATESSLARLRRVFRVR